MMVELSWNKYCDGGFVIVQARVPGIERVGWMPVGLVGACSGEGRVWGIKDVGHSCHRSIVEDLKVLENDINGSVDQRCSALYYSWQKIRQKI